MALRVKGSRDHRHYASTALPQQAEIRALTAARALLAEAGFPGGNGFPPLAMQVLNDDKLPRIAETIQAMWKRELGVSITIEPSEQKIWVQIQQSLGHTIAIRGWTADFPDPTAFLDIFRTGNGSNYSGWSSKAYDTLLDDAAATVNPTARFALLKKAETLLLDESVTAPLVFGARTYLIHAAVKNWEPAPLLLRRFQLIELRP